MAQTQACYDRISRSLSQKMVEEREMKWNVRHLKYQEELIKEEVKLVVEKLNKLQLCLDKLSFTNTAYKTTSFLSAGELDKQKLQFLLRHGSKNMAKEKKLLRDINTSQKSKQAGTTLDELEAPIKNLDEQIKNSRMHLYRTDFEEIYREKKVHEMEKETAVANAGVGGRLWSSLGSKKHVQRQVQILYEELDELRLKQVEIRDGGRFVEKKLGWIEKQIVFLRTQIESIRHV
ncbi:uncharacterized protein LOC111457179 isoform X2 [Cucurbita moschata]|uniref:Uncharacterized protein LOC111457179 isoform X2 n=1 Tax=Cucurbita moschata TaxID=3662 RepID=A0A6J1GT27_CUCMO|nr:uncharacterized protein LOC111457179 isoform X2 [Cucurbita moschata]